MKSIAAKVTIIMILQQQDIPEYDCKRPLELAQSSMVALAKTT